jgi:transposase
MAARVAITPEQIEELAKLLSLSASLDPACALAGIARRSCYRYLSTGRKVRATLDAGDTTEARLSEAEARALLLLKRVEWGEAQSQVCSLAIINAAAETQWRAAAWLLERRHPKRWARRGWPTAPGPTPHREGLTRRTRAT